MLHVANHTHNSIRSFYIMLEGSENSEYQIQGHSQDFRVGGAEYVRVQFLATPTFEMERSKFKLSQRTRSDGN